MFNATKNSPTNDIATIKNVKKDISNEIFDAANKGGQKIRELVSSAADETYSAVKNLNAQIEHNPRQAVLVSMCAGFLLGLLARR